MNGFSSCAPCSRWRRVAKASSRFSAKMATHKSAVRVSSGRAMVRRIVSMLGRGASDVPRVRIAISRMR